MGSFFDIFGDFFKNYEDSVDAVKEKINSYDLTTDEGYGEYMKFLGDLRVKADKYNDIFKIILGENVGDLIDRIAQDATNQYEEAKKKKAGEAKKAEEAKKETVLKTNICKEQPSDKKIDIAEEHKCCKCNDCHAWPSDKVSDEVYDSICNIVERYMDEYSYDDEKLNDWLEAELIEFASWLHKQ